MAIGNREIGIAIVLAGGAILVLNAANYLAGGGTTQSASALVGISLVAIGTYLSRAGGAMEKGLRKPPGKKGEEG